MHTAVWSAAIAAAAVGLCFALQSPSAWPAQFRIAACMLKPACLPGRVRCCSDPHWAACSTHLHQRMGAAAHIPHRHLPPSVPGSLAAQRSRACTCAAHSEIMVYFAFSCSRKARTPSITENRPLA